MATTPETTPQTIPESTDPVFNIQRVYLKEISLEQPNSPAIFLETEQPQIAVQISIENLQLADGIFETCVTIGVHATINEKTVFLVEAKQAAIFEARNIPEDQIAQVLGISCPTIIYPYLRSNIADMITRAGFPPVHLTEVNFQTMYEQQLAEAAAGDTK
jgi:preprotein translocase subunit SecB